MSNLTVLTNKEDVAHAAAEHTVETLRACIEQNGHASWVLAGGSTPLAAYSVIATVFADALDWTKVTFLLGDERIGPLDDPDNNWHAIDAILHTIPASRLRPASDEAAEAAATRYEAALESLPKTDNGLPCFDLVWLGVGQDGHTLSLFPNHESLFPSSSLVIPVHDSPKPPRDRISLSLRALQSTKHAVILACGADKQAAVQAARSGSQLPIALATDIIATHGGTVTWFVDSAAATD